MNRILFSTLAAAMLTASQSALGQDEYRVVDTIRIERSGSLYLDPVNGKLFITQSPFDRYNAGALVVSTANNMNAGRLSVDPRIGSVGTIAVAPDLSRGWTSNGEDRSLTVFDLHSFAVDKEIKLKDIARSAAYDPSTKRVFVVSRREVYAVDANSGEVVATIPVGDRATYIEPDGKGMLYLSMADPGTGQIVVIDAKEAKEVKRYKLDKCAAPGRLAIDPATGHLFAACSNRTISVSDVNTDKVISSITTRQNVNRLIFDPRVGLLAPLAADDALTIVKRDGSGNYAAATGAALQLKGLRVVDMRVDPNSGRMFVAASGAAGRDFRILVVEKK